MAILRVQPIVSGGNAASAGTLVITVPSLGAAMTVGNHMILTAVISGTATGFSSCADSKGNTWQVDVSKPPDAAGNGGVGIASCKFATALVAGDTITLTFAASSRAAAWVDEYSGIATASWLDKTASASDGGVAATAADSSATATTAQADELLIGAIAIGGAFTAFTPEVLSPVWTVDGSAASTGTVRTIENMHRIVSATGTYSAKATWTTARDWTAGIATYKAAAGGGGAVLAGSWAGVGAWGASGLTVAGGQPLAGAFAGVGAWGASGLVIAGGQPLIGSFAGVGVWGANLSAGGAGAVLAGSWAGVSAWLAALTPGGAGAVLAGAWAGVGTWGASLTPGAALVIGRPIEYVVELYDSDANFGPNNKLAEIWDARNVGWSTYDRLPGKAFLTLSQTSLVLPLFVPLTTHIKVWRISSLGETLVYSGAYIDYNSTGDDVILSAYDYKALLATSRAGFKTLYPTKKIGTEIVAPEWVLAKTTTPNSPLAFVATGTIEDPLGNDAVTPIKTGAGFGTLDQQRLQLFFDLSEIGRANTPNNTTYDISRTTPHTFTFLKNKGASSGIPFVLGGNVSDYAYLPHWTSYRNDLASAGIGASGGAAEIVKKDDTEAAARGRRQDVFAIQTLLGITGAATEADQQQAALARALRKSLTLQPTLQLRLVRGSHDTFSGYDINDKVTVEIGNGIESLTGEWRLIGEVGIMRENGEQQSVIVAPVST